MRPKCKCGKIAGYWYAPVIYKIMEYDEYLQSHAYCMEHADTENWAEYELIGFHKTDWQWLKKKETLAYIVQRNEWLSKPYYDVSHIKNGVRWALGRYRDMNSVREATQGLQDVIITEGFYD